MIDARGRVHLLGYDQRLWLQIEGNRCVRARSGAYGLHFALRRLDAGNRIHHGFQMFRSGAATSADDSYAVVFDEVFVILCQVFRGELVHCVSADVLRQSGVRQN